MVPGSSIQVSATSKDKLVTFQAKVMVQSMYEMEYLRKGGIFQVFDTRQP
jgi:hypothetical protein